MKILENIVLYEDFLPTHEEVFSTLRKQVSWRQDTVEVWNKVHNVPRLQQWFGDEGLTYKWSGIQMQPQTWTPSLLEVKQQLQEDLGLSFNSALCNLYRDGQDTVGWHADNEPELGRHPVIASLSLGATRDFILRKTSNPSEKIKVELKPGSLLVMSGDIQEKWQHSLPRRKNVTQERINVTFRTVK